MSFTTDYCEWRQLFLGICHLAQRVVDMAVTVVVVLVLVLLLLIATQGQTHLLLTLGKIH